MFWLVTLPDLLTYLRLRLLMAADGRRYDHPPRRVDL
jgi:hypothetical protein